MWHFKLRSFENWIEYIHSYDLCFKHVLHVAILVAFQIEAIWKLNWPKVALPILIISICENLTPIILEFWYRNNQCWASAKSWFKIDLVLNWLSTKELIEYHLIKVLFKLIPIFLILYLTYSIIIGFPKFKTLIPM